MDDAASGPSAHVVELAAKDGGRSILDALTPVSIGSPAVGLARALAASPPAATLSGVILVVRTEPDPALVFSGHVDPAGRARLHELPGLLAEAGPRLRLITWGQVEELVLRLADRLRAQVPEELLPSCRLVGVPRGGAVVVGLLAYALGVPRERVGGEVDDELLVIVDDCSISGLRLRDVLAEHRSERVAFATLLSSPGLREAVRHAEQRVVGFASGDDLHDHGDELLDDYAGWRRTWSERVPERYHTGLLDLVCFPWSEPDLRLWNPVTETIEPSWWLAPPEACLAHRVAASHLEVQVAEDNPGSRWLAGHVVPVEHEEATGLVDLDGGPGVRLTDVARELWHAWSRDGDEERAADQVAEVHAQPVGGVRDDLDRLLRGLRERGLLRPD